MRVNHYDYLNKHLMAFFERIGIKNANEGIIVAHGDKCYCHREDWEDHGIPFPQGVAIYLASYCKPFSAEVRNTANGWVDPFQWVIDNFHRFRPFLP